MVWPVIETEQFDNVGELCAAILAKGVALQLKRGLGKEYIPQTEPLSSLRGKIDTAESIKTQAMLRKQLVCTYDDFTVNSYMNRILKSTMELLVRSDISKARKKELRKLLAFFGEVEPLNVYDINWRLQYNRNKAVEHLGRLMVEDRSIRMVTVKKIEPERRRKKVAYAVYEYQADNEGEWGEIHFDFKKWKADIKYLADYDTSKTHVYARKAMQIVFDSYEEGLPDEKTVFFSKW